MASFVPTSKAATATESEIAKVLLDLQTSGGSVSVKDQAIQSNETFHKTCSGDCFITFETPHLHRHIVASFLHYIRQNQSDIQQLLLSLLYSTPNSVPVKQLFIRASQNQMRPTSSPFVDLATRMTSWHQQQQYMMPTLMGGVNPYAQHYTPQSYCPMGQNQSPFVSQTFPHPYLPHQGSLITNTKGTLSLLDQYDYQYTKERQTCQNKIILYRCKNYQNSGCRSRLSTNDKHYILKFKSSHTCM